MSQNATTTTTTVPAVITPQSSPAAVAAAIAAAGTDPAKIAAILAAFGAGPATRGAGRRVPAVKASPAFMRRVWDATGMTHAALDAIVGSANTYTVAHVTGDRWIVPTAAAKIATVVAFMDAADRKSPDPIRGARIAAIRAMVAGGIPAETAAERDAKIAAEASRK